MVTDMTTLRIITNDAYSQVPCIMSEEDFSQQARELGWDDADFSEAGPEVESEEDVREHAGVYADDCVLQFRHYQTP